MRKRVNNPHVFQRNRRGPWPGDGRGSACLHPCDRLRGLDSLQTIVEDAGNSSSPIWCFPAPRNVRPLLLLLAAAAAAAVKEEGSGGGNAPVTVRIARYRV